jgi:hypothetical protein
MEGNLMEKVNKRRRKLSENVRGRKENDCGGSAFFGGHSAFGNAKERQQKKEHSVHNNFALLST